MAVVSLPAVMLEVIQAVMALRRLLDELNSVLSRGVLGRLPRWDRRVFGPSFEEAREEVAAVG